MTPKVIPRFLAPVLGALKSMSFATASQIAQRIDADADTVRVRLHELRSLGAVAKVRDRNVAFWMARDVPIVAVRMSSRRSAKVSSGGATTAREMTDGT